MDLAEEIDEGPQPQDIKSELPELSMTTLKKLYNTRPKNERQDLQQNVSGAYKDIHDITQLLLSLRKYRTETMGQLNKELEQLIKKKTRQIRVDDGDDAIDKPEGILGARPSNLTSVAELMLFDSDVNVYEERNVTLQQENVFNIRGHKQKVLSKKEKEAKEKKIKEQMVRKKIKEKRRKNQIIDQAAPTKINDLLNAGGATNEHAYVATNDEDIDLNLNEDLLPRDDDSDGNEEDFETYEKRRKEQDAQRRQNVTQNLEQSKMDASMSMMNPNATMGGTLARIDESGFIDNTVDDI